MSGANSRLDGERKQERNFWQWLTLARAECGQVADFKNRRAIIFRKALRHLAAPMRFGPTWG